MRKVKIKQDFYMFIIAVWYTNEIIFNTMAVTIFGIPKETVNFIMDSFILIMLLLQIIFCQTYETKEVVIIALITVVVVIAVIFSKTNFLLSTWMFIVAAKNTNFNRVIKMAYRILCVMIPLVIALCLFGVLEDYKMYRGSIIRHSLGFSHPNQLGLRIFQLVLCHCYIHKNNLKLKNFVFIFIAVIFAIKVPNSQTAYIELLVFGILVLIWELIKKSERIVQRFFLYSMVVGSFVFGIASVWLTIIDVRKYPVLGVLDDFLSTRFWQCHRVYRLYGISFWGQRIYVSIRERESIGLTQKLFLDNAYAAILLRFGVVVFVLFFLSYLGLMLYFIKQQESFLVIIMFVFSLYGIMEMGLYQVTNNIFLIVYASLLYQTNHSLDWIEWKREYI